MKTIWTIPNLFCRAAATAVLGRLSMSRVREETNRGRIVTLALLFSLLSMLVPVPATAAVPDPERSSDAITGWHWWHNVSESQLKSKYESKNERIIDLEVDRTGPHRFTAALVRNKGPYQRAWWWYFGKSRNQVVAKTAAKKGRIIDLEPYTVNGQRRFAFAMVKNTGGAKKGWWWNYDLTASQVTKDINKHGIRLIDLDSYKVGGKRRYSYVGIRNKGVDKRAWWWYHNVSASFVSNKLNEHKARLIDVERPAPGKMTVVMQRNEGRFWLWYHGMTEQRLNEITWSNAVRIIDIEKYKVSGKTRYAAVMLDNANSEAARLRSIFRKSVWKDSYFGVYLKRVRGQRYGRLAHDRLYQPLSVMKLVPHLYVMDLFDKGAVDLDDPRGMSWVAPVDDPDAVHCVGAPGNTQTYWESIRTTLTRALGESLNRAHEALLNKYTPEAITARVKEMGLKRTNMYYGCKYPDKPNWLSSRTTLVDMGKLFEGVETQAFFPQQWQLTRNEFYGLMASWNKAPVKTVVESEAAKLGLSGVVDAFMASVEVKGKGGGADWCDGNGKCRASRAFSHRTLLPFKVEEANGRLRTDLIPFVGGFFGLDMPAPCVEDSAHKTPDEVTQQCLAWDAKMHEIWNQLSGEPLRPAIRQALKSWAR